MLLERLVVGRFWSSPGSGAGRCSVVRRREAATAIASSKKVIIGGRLDRDPEIHTFEGGDRVARAVDRDNGAMNQRQYAPGKDRLAHCSLVQESTGHIDRPE